MSEQEAAGWIRVGALSDQAWAAARSHAGEIQVVAQLRLEDFDLLPPAERARAFLTMRMIASLVIGDLHLRANASLGNERKG
jgi:hypothetical protein